MSRLTRQEMKRDEVREVLSRAMAFLGEHARQIGIGLLVLALLAIAVSAWRARAGGRQDRASEALADALDTLEAPLDSEVSPAVASETETFATAEARRAAARSALDRVVAEFPRSSSARFARSYIAELELEEGRPEAARDIWRKLAEGAGDDAFGVQMILNLNAIERETGEAAATEERLLAMVDDPDSSLPQPLALYELGVTQEELGKVEESRATFQRLLDEHPTSPWARVAAERVDVAAGGV